jgi:hypothetical protein
MTEKPTAVAIAEDGNAIKGIVIATVPSLIAWALIAAAIGKVIA